MPGLSDEKMWARCEVILTIIRENPGISTQAMRDTARNRGSKGIGGSNLSRFTTRLRKAGLVYSRRKRSEDGRIFHVWFPGQSSEPKVVRRFEPRQVIYHADDIDDVTNMTTLQSASDEVVDAITEAARRMLDYREGFDANRGTKTAPQVRTTPNPDTPIRDLFKDNRDDVLETRYSACAFWLSWRLDQMPEAA